MLAALERLDLAALGGSVVPSSPKECSLRSGRGRAFFSLRSEEEELSSRCARERKSFLLASLGKSFCSLRSGEFTPRTIAVLTQPVRTIPRPLQLGLYECNVRPCRTQKGDTVEVVELLACGAAPS
jgi:hypothetical protein